MEVRPYGSQDEKLQSVKIVQAGEFRIELVYSTWLNHSLSEDTL
jgi:hypothetical protein